MARTGEWGAAPLGVTWSVALEEQFYLFLPLWIRLVPVRWLPVSFLGLAAVGPVFRAIAPLAHAPFLVPGSGEALFLGTWLAWAFAYKPESFKSSAWRKSVLGLLALGAIGMGLIVARRNFGVFSISVISIFWASFLWLVLAFMGTPWTAPLRHFTFRSVGGISYGVYLFHPLVNQLLLCALTGAPPSHETSSVKGFCIALLAFAFTLAFAALSFYGMESRLIALGRKFKYLRPDPAKSIEGGGSTTVDQLRVRTGRDFRRRSQQEFLFEELEGSFPRRFRGRLIVAGCGVVVKSVVHAGIDKRFVFHSRSLEGFFIIGPAGVNAGVELGIMKHQRALDFRRVLGGRLASIIRHCGLDELGQAPRQGVCHATTETKPGHSDRSIAVGMGVQKFYSCDKILRDFFAVQFLLHGPAGIVITRITAGGIECIGGESHETGQSHSAGDVLNVGIEPTVFMHDDNARSNRPDTALPQAWRTVPASRRCLRARDI